MFEALDHALATIEADKSIRAMVLRGEGSAFSSGVDLRELEQIEASGARWALPRRTSSGVSKRCRFRLSRPCRARR